jgi:hypothetical protein
MTRALFLGREPIGKKKAERRLSRTIWSFKNEQLPRHPVYSLVRRDSTRFRTRFLAPHATQSRKTSFVSKLRVGGLRGCLEETKRRS